MITQARFYLAFVALAALALPACHGSLFAMHQQHMAQVCADSQQAYELGYNNGLKRESMDTSWIRSSCAPAQHRDTEDAYLEGYHEGVDNAPAVVVTNQSTSSSSAGVSCTFSSDCGDGDFSCRNWGSAGQVCMGYGEGGDPCWFSSDCLSDSCGSAGGAPGKTCR